MRTKGLTYSDHIAASVKNLISWTQTEAIFKKKKEKKMEEGAVCLWRGSRNNPSGPRKCRSPLPFGNVSSRLLSNFGCAGCLAAALWLVYLVILTLRSAHAWQIVDRMPQGIGSQQDFAPLVFCFFFNTPSFHYALGTRKLIERYSTAGQPPDRGDLQLGLRDWCL